MTTPKDFEYKRHVLVERLVVVAIHTLTPNKTFFDERGNKNRFVKM